jgi:hypothetical protein
MRSTTRTTARPLPFAAGTVVLLALVLGPLRRARRDRRPHDQWHRYGCHYHRMIRRRCVVALRVLTQGASLPTSAPMRTLIAALMVVSVCSFLAPAAQAQSALNLTGTWAGTETQVFLLNGKKTKTVDKYEGPLYFQIQDNGPIDILLGSGAAQYKCVIDDGNSSPAGLGFLTCALCGSDDFGAGNTRAKVIGGFVTKSAKMKLTGAFGRNGVFSAGGAQIILGLKRVDTVPPVGFVDCSTP